MARESERATLSDDADVEAWWTADADVTGRLVAAIAFGCARAPALNARIDPALGRFERLRSVDIGVVVDTAQGAVIPVLCDIAHTSVVEIRRRLTELRKLVASGPCAPSITFVNFGKVAGRYAELPVPPDQAGLVAAGQVFLRATEKDGHVVQHHMLPLSVSFDLRACGVGDAATFLAAMKADLAKPELPLTRGWRAQANEAAPDEGPRNARSPRGRT
ncbi:MAG TPA: 2-oxo acid dehydrogenase subunit E2 [Stellaceae bacterium]|nr:2-oxo acid dehydrogenase subunit E2 [Stellaceae bacterium]